MSLARGGASRGASWFDKREDLPCRPRALNLGKRRSRAAKSFQWISHTTSNSSLGFEVKLSCDAVRPSGPPRDTFLGNSAIVFRKFWICPKLKSNTQIPLNNLFLPAQQESLPVSSSPIHDLRCVLRDSSQPIETTRRVSS